MGTFAPGARRSCARRTGPRIQQHPPPPHPVQGPGLNFPSAAWAAAAGGAASGSEHTYCRSSSQLCRARSSVAWKSISVVLRVKESRERRSGSSEVSRKTWRATVRGTYPTPKAGTRAYPVRTVRGALGAKPPCASGTYPTREAGTRSLYVPNGGAGAYASAQRKTCGRLVCEASRREKAMALPSAMVTCTGTRVGRAWGWAQRRGSGGGSR